jgi:hypothetical protein
MRFGTVTSWQPEIATGYIEEDGMAGSPEHNMFSFHSSQEFAAGDRVSFEVSGSEAVNIQLL